MLNHIHSLLFSVKILFKFISSSELVVHQDLQEPPDDEDLFTSADDELDEMRNRINGLRTLIKDSLAAQGVAQDFSFIDKQNGMFSFLGINKEQIERLQKEYAIYIVGSSRVNVAGVSQANIEYFSKAVAEVLK